MSASGGRGKHPHSKQNLEKGRCPKHGEHKKSLQLTVTPTGAAGAAQVAQEMGISLSELIELIGRRQISIIRIGSSI